jgi:hypothetical protein
MPYQYAQSLTGAPLPNALLYFYSSGTVTPLNTYSEDTLTIANTNPVKADQYGVFPDIFLQNLLYRVVLQEQPTATGGPGAEIWTADPVSPFIPSGVSQTLFLVAEVTVDGAGSPPATGICGDSYVPVACTIQSAVLQALTSGDLVVDVWAAPFVVGSPPTITNSIVASAPPTLSSADSSINTTLTGWSLSLAAGTWLRYNINSASTLTHFTLSLVCSIP